MASQIGIMKEFQESNEDFGAYLERLEMWYDAN